MFQARYRLVAWFDNVQGLVPGAAVWLAGTRVGRVASVDLALRPDGMPGVKVEMQIDEAVEACIRERRVREQVRELHLQQAVASAQRAQHKAQSGRPPHALHPFHIPHICVIP